MKFSIILSILFAFIYIAQAHDVTLSLTVFHDNESSIHGEVKGQLIGKTKTYPFAFDTKVFEKKQRLYTETKFPEEVQAITATWMTESDVPLKLDSIVMIFNNEKIFKIFSPEEQSLQRGETTKFAQ